MKIKTITITNQPQHPGHLQLRRSLEHFGYDYHVISTYRWFGDKMIQLEPYLESIRSEYSHFLFIDAHDTFVLDTLDELAGEYYDHFEVDRIVMSCEKACWPKPELAEQYPPIESDWRYINSGSYIAPIDTWLAMWRENKVPHTYDDQLWYHERYLSRKYPISLDADCVMFQSLAFDEVGYDRGDIQQDGDLIVNLKTGTYPIVAHGNGKTAMEWVYNML